MNNRKRPLITGIVCVFALSAGLCSAKTAGPVRCRVELDRDVLYAEREQTAVVKITLDADRPLNVKERPPVNLSIVLDRSGSMSGKKLERAKEAAIEALHRLDGRDIFSLVVYNHKVKTVVEAQSASNTEWIEKRIRSIGSNGNTALFAGVSQGAAEVRKNIEENFVHRIILLSDGLANVGPSSASDLGRLGAGLLKEGISVTTVGVGNDYNEDLMARLSRKSDGNTYFVENSRGLARIFKEELGDLLSVVARKVKLIIECPDGVRPLRIIGREGRIHSGNVELYLNQLYGGQEKFALVEVKLPAVKAGEKREIAVARVRYENVFTEDTESATGRVDGAFSENRKTVEESENVKVRASYEVNLNAMAQEKAIKLADEGKAKEAAKVLKESAQKLDKVGKKYGDSALVKRARQIEVQAESIEQEGLSKGGRKALRSESYQTIRQQRAR
ncbi:MAG: vWA domain-containing protein [Verrucomicrobiota bacterium]